MFARNYHDLFNNLVASQLNDLSEDYANGYDLSALNENVGFLAGMFTDFLVSPFEQDEFMFLGFSFFTDAPKAVKSMTSADTETLN